MANADIMLIGLSELPLIVELYNEVYRPPHDQEFFERRFSGRNNPLILLAQIERHPVGFALGFEIKPSTFYCWLIGVLPDFRRSGVASQLMEAMSAWARDNGYTLIRFECYNHHRPMLHLGISQNYNVVGIRYDADAEANLIIMEQSVHDLLDG